MPIRKPVIAERIEEYFEELELLTRGFDLLDDHVVITDTNGNILYANKAVERNTGYSRKEIIGKNPGDLWGGHMPDEYYRAMWKRLKEEKQSFVGEVRNFRKDGTEHWQEFHITPVFGKDGAPRFFIGLELDITDRKRRENFADQIVHTIFSEATDFNSALASTLQSLCVFTGWDFGEAWLPDEAGTRLEFQSIWYSASPEFEPFIAASREITFSSGEGLPGRVWQSQAHEWIRDVSAASPKSFLRGEAARAVGLKSALGIPLVIDGKVAAVIALFTRSEREEDEVLVSNAVLVVNELGVFIKQKKLEETLVRAHVQSEMEKSNFITTVGHQLRNALTSTGWSLEVLMGTPELPDAQKDLLHAAYESNANLTALVNDLITLSRVGSGKMPADEFDLGEEVSAIVALQKRRHPDRSFIWKQEGGFPLRVNKSLARQVFENIIANAAEYSNPKTGVVTVSLVQEGGEYLFSCSDNGIGIPKKDQQKIFSRFFRASNAVAEKETGTGLGLFIVKMIADAFGWRVSFESTEGKGTTFFVRIPGGI